MISYSRKTKVEVTDNFKSEIEKIMPLMEGSKPPAKRSGEIRKVGNAYVMFMDTQMVNVISPDIFLAAVKEAEQATKVNWFTQRR
jgi:hypothetical protein